MSISIHLVSSGVFTFYMHPRVNGSEQAGWLHIACTTGSAALAITDGHSQAPQGDLTPPSLISIAIFRLSAGGPSSLTLTAHGDGFSGNIEFVPL